MPSPFRLADFGAMDEEAFVGRRFDRDIKKCQYSSKQFRYRFQYRLPYLNGCFKVSGWLLPEILVESLRVRMRRIQRLR